MKLVSVNVAAPQMIRRGKTDRMTGIFKQRVDGPVEVTAQGLAGDHILDTKNHGGPDQAVYVFTTPDYAWWSAELGRELPPGTFGENLTVTDIDSAGLQVGDRLRVGAVVLEVTAPRVPCATLAARMEDPGFVVRFRDAVRPGVYCRVITPGTVQAGDPVAVTGHAPAPGAGEPITAGEFFQLFYAVDIGADDLRRLLAAPLPAKMRAVYADKLAALGG